MLRKIISFLFKSEINRSPEWTKVRAEWLKDHPICRACGSKEKLEVHHKYPFSWPNGHITELDKTNLITLCDRCHLIFGHLGDWKSRNPDIEDDSIKILAKIQNRPYPKDFNE